MGVATEFVYVERTEHGDFMHIPKQVQEKYPKIYKLVVEEAPAAEESKVSEVVKETVVVKKSAPVKKGK